MYVSPVHQSVCLFIKNIDSWLSYEFPQRLCDKKKYFCMWTFFRSNVILLLWCYSSTVINVYKCCTHVILASCHPVMSFLYEVINTLMSKLSNCVNYIFWGSWGRSDIGNRLEIVLTPAYICLSCLLLLLQSLSLSTNVRVRKSFSPRSSHIVSFIHSFIAVMRIHYWQFPLTIHGIHVRLNIFTYQRFAPVSPSVSRSDSDVLIVKYQKCNRNTEM